MGNMEVKSGGIVWLASYAPKILGRKKRCCSPGVEAPSLSNVKLHLPLPAGCSSHACMVPQSYN